MVRKLSLLIALMMTVLSHANTGFAAEVVSVVERTRVPLGESFRMELRVNGDADGEPDFSQLEERFEILGTSQSI